MIRDAEIRRIAGAAGVEPRIVELDYALGWALRGIAAQDFLADRLIFKGGTCLRKCHLPDYRFSEDLDFTARQWFEWEEFQAAVDEAFTETAQISGLDFAAREPRLKVIENEYGRETLRFTLYWRGPHATGGSPPGLRLDITRNEVVFFEPVRRKIIHDFSDSGELGEVELNCYSLDEVMSEKVRAVLGQRIFAVSRDLYDIFRLRDQVDDPNVLDALPAKLEARDVDAGDVGLRRLTSRKDEFRADWERNLAGLLPPGAEEDFEQVWEEVAAYVGRMADGLGIK